MLIPKGQTGHTTRSIRNRTKLPHLHGAVMYVVRLGWKVHGSTAQSAACCVHAREGVEVDTPPRPSIGSLHEELMNPYKKTTCFLTTNITARDKEPSVLLSRPCYRCISYMSRVGIKRVFWTTGTGIWQGAKVRDLVDAIGKSGTEQLSIAAATLNNIFVTKHEVLMLRRTMREN
jgi:hypothetical protein